MNVSVFASNEAFGKMLVFEIESIGRSFNVKLNDPDFAEKSDLIVADLDGACAKNDYTEKTVIGFSRNEDKLDKTTLDKCKIILHRPFLITQLLDCIERVASGDNKTTKITAEADLQFLKGGLVTLDGRGVKLSSNEYAMLRLLFKKVGEPVSREELSSVLSSSEGNMCDVYICKLRTKLESVSNRKLIYTVRSRGYTLKI